MNNSDISKTRNAPGQKAETKAAEQTLLFLLQKAV